MPTPPLWGLAADHELDGLTNLSIFTGSWSPTARQHITRSITMGGTIAMIVRKPDGETQPMLRHTNPMPYHLSTSAFLQGDFERWWPEFSQAWREMKTDYEQNNGTGNFQEPMTSTYFPHDTLSPEGYGLVVVDFQSRHVLSCQGYTSLGEEGLHRWSRMEPEERADLFRRQAAGMLNTLVVTYLDKSIPEGSPEDRVKDISLPIGQLGPQGIGKLLELWEGERGSAFEPDGDQTLGGLCANLGIACPEGLDPGIEAPLRRAHIPYQSGWTFERFDDDASGIAQLRQRCGDIGLNFSEQDDLKWREFMLESLDLPGEGDDVTPEERIEIQQSLDDSLGVLGWSQTGPIQKTGHARPR